MNKSNKILLFENNKLLINVIDKNGITIEKNYFKKIDKNIYEIHKIYEYDNEGILIKRTFYNHVKTIQINEYKNGHCINSKFI